MRPPLTLDTLRLGEKAEISGISTQDQSLHRKLLTMGITPGRHIEVECKAPLGDPITVRTQASSPLAPKMNVSHGLSLRLTEAQAVRITPRRTAAC